MRSEELFFILANSARRGIREPSVVDSIRNLSESDLPPRRSQTRRAGRSMIRVAVEARARQLLWHFNEWRVFPPSGLKTLNNSTLADFAGPAGARSTDLSLCSLNPIFRYLSTVVRSTKPANSTVIPL